MKSEDGSKRGDEAAWEGQAGVVQFKNKFFKKPFYGDTNILTVAFVEIHIYILSNKISKNRKYWWSSFYGIFITSRLCLAG